MTTTRRVRFDGKTAKQHERAANRAAGAAGLDVTDVIDVGIALHDWLDWVGWTVCGGKYTAPNQERIDAFVAREIAERKGKNQRSACITSDTTASSTGQAANLRPGTCSRTPLMP